MREVKQEVDKPYLVKKTQREVDEGGLNDKGTNWVVGKKLATSAQGWRILGNAGSKGEV